MGQDLIKPIDQRVRNRQLVLEAVLRSPGISRTALADAIGLNVASVSRITRALIDAGLIMEADSFGPRDRPGRRFVGLKPCGEGGYAIGIAINAFHQTVTLADLSNSKIDEWNSPETPGPCGEDFLRLCLQNAADLVDAHVRDKGRLLGVGIAVAGELDAQRGYVQSAPILGWTDPVNVARLVKEILDVPLVLATPPNAMNAADADIGLGQQIENLTTLNCSLGYGIGARQGAVNGQALEFGRIVAGIKAPGSDLTLAQVCGGTAVLRQVYGVEGVEGIPDYQLGGMLIELIQNPKRTHHCKRSSVVQGSWLPGIWLWSSTSASQIGWYWLARWWVRKNSLPGSRDH